jgi:predicted DCC family thiol-disulfide oxidoreductase YuxK
LKPPTRPLLIYDGDCDFCRRWIARWQRVTRDRVDYAPTREAAGRFPEIPAEDFARSVILVEPDGAVSRGADAVIRSLSHAGRGRLAAWCYRRVPGFARLSEAAYRLVAANRGRLDPLGPPLCDRHVGERGDGGPLEGEPSAPEPQEESR